MTLLAQPLNVMTPQPSLVKQQQLPQREEFQEYVMQLVTPIIATQQPLSYVAPQQQQTLQRHQENVTLLVQPMNAMMP